MLKCLIQGFVFGFFWYMQSCTILSTPFHSFDDNHATGTYRASITCSSPCKVIVLVGVSFCFAFFVQPGLVELG